MGATNKSVREEIKVITKELVKKCINRYVERINVLDEHPDFVCDNHVRDKAIDPIIMYKLSNDGGALSLKGRGGREYEFLVEFDPYNFAYGIYFGCRCTLHNRRKIATQVEECNDEWQHIRERVIEALNNTFVDLDFSDREIPTDNVSDRTYWPFWFRLGEEESVQDVAALATKIIRNVYRWFLDDENYDLIMKEPIAKKIKRGRKKETAVHTRYTNKEYNAVIEQLKDTSMYCPDAVTYFEKFMDTLLRNDIIRRYHLYEKCWIVNGMENCDFAEIVAEFSNRITTKIKEVKEVVRDGKIVRIEIKNISWSLFSPIMLSSGGSVFDEIRKQYGHKAIDIEVEKYIKQIMAEVFGEIN